MVKHTVAFLGLGTMGFPMAGHLARAGYPITVFNRTADIAKRWACEYAGNTAASPAEAAHGADMVFSCVGNDDDLRSITLGPKGAFASMRPGTVFVDHTTTSADIARELSANAAEQGFDFIDAPVSGGQAGAEQGCLTVMCGGREQAFERVQHVVNCYARSVMLMGNSGAGQLTKMVNQICIAGLLQGLSEGVAFAINADLDPHQVFSVIAKGAAQSWQMEHRHATMISNEFDFGFAVDWMRKDLGLCLQEAGRNGSQLPITRLVDEYYAEVQDAGGQRFDTSSLVTRLPRKDHNQQQ